MKDPALAVLDFDFEKWWKIGVGLLLGLMLAAMLAYIAVMAYHYANADQIAAEKSLLANLSKSKTCDPTTLVLMEQLEISIFRTKDDYINVFCERYFPGRKFR